MLQCHWQRLSRWILVSGGLVFLGLGSAACKQAQPDAGDAETISAGPAPQIEFYADSTPYLRKNADFYFDLWDEEFSTRLDDLPMNGEVPADRRPYSGHWYPESVGGTNVIVSGNASPLAKYDAAFHNGENKAVQWEREKHSGTVSWAGHCNGFGAAASRHAEPRQNVERGGVTFTPYDIKALMVELYMSADFEFIGGNRCEAPDFGGDPNRRPDPTVMGVCEDINPGTLHAAIANWIGRKGVTLVMDEHSNEEVWNYPLYKYAYQILNRSLSAEAARQLVGGFGDYVFNPNAQQFAHIRTTLTYAGALSREQLNALTPKTVTLEYVLELDGTGNIIGGEWARNSQAEHPDFLWIALSPREPNGTRFMGNPHVEADQVISMWAESAGRDVDDDFRLERPLQEETWGRWPNFEIVLDGNRRGAVFGGKPINVRVERRNALGAAEANLVLGLNGRNVEELSGNLGETLNGTIEPGPGVNRLRFYWEQGGEKLEERFLRFHVGP